jgi:hypothetical protein
VTASRVAASGVAESGWAAPGVLESGLVSEIPLWLPHPAKASAAGKTAIKSNRLLRVICTLF